jgi:hypothetical protein
MSNVSKINFIRKIPNQTLKATYYAPKSQRDIEEFNPNYKTLKPSELKNLYADAFMEEHRGEFTETNGQVFRYKDGTEDVYVKSGYEHDVFEYLDRQLMNKYKYRIITDVTHIDFKAGGRVMINGVFFEVLKVINMTNDIPTQNKFRMMPYVQDFQRYAPKVIALV